MSPKANNKSDQWHQVILSPPYKRRMREWLNAHFRDELIKSIKSSNEASHRETAERLQQLIRTKLAGDGIKDAEDMYQIVGGTTAEEFWCDILNEIESQQE
jgi:(p)ppGpp synthase/HD superfamily hydrolase